MPGFRRIGGLVLCLVVVSVAVGGGWSARPPARAADTVEFPAGFLDAPENTNFLRSLAIPQDKLTLVLSMRDTAEEGQPPFWAEVQALMIVEQEREQWEWALTETGAQHNYHEIVEQIQPILDLYSFLSTASVGWAYGSGSVPGIIGDYLRVTKWMSEWDALKDAAEVIDNFKNLPDRSMNEFIWWAAQVDVEVFPANWDTLSLVAPDMDREGGMALAHHIYVVVHDDMEADKQELADKLLKLARQSGVTIADLGQFEADGRSSVAVGGRVAGDELVVSATVASPSAPVRLEVVTRPAGSLSAGSREYESSYGAGGRTTLTVSLADYQPGQYVWLARASDRNGGASVWTSFGGDLPWNADFIVGDVAGTLTAPTLKSVKPRADGASPGIVLEWTAVARAACYEIYRDSLLLCTTRTLGTTFWNTGLMPGRRYSYQVRARNGYQFGPLSAAVSAVAPAPDLSATQPRVVVDSNPVPLDVAPTNVSGSLLVPIRAISEALGAEVSWDQATQAVTLTLGGTMVKLVLGSKQATLSGKTVTLTVAAVNVNGRILVPLRFVGESFGAEVAWKQETQTVVIIGRRETPSTRPVVTSIPYSGPVTIHGYVMDERGKPAHVGVVFDAYGLGDQGSVMTDYNGYYEKQLAGSAQYIVSVNPGPARQIGGYFLPAGYLTERKLVIPTEPDVRVDFVARDGGTLWLRAYDEYGNEMSTQDFTDASKTGAFPLGAFPYGDSIQTNYRGFPLYWGWIQNSDRNTACLLLPPGDPAEIWMLWRLPQVGTTFLHADNGGKGFSVEKGDVLPVNLVYEFARTEYREASQRYQELQGTGYTFSSDVANWLAEADYCMTRAESYQQLGARSDSAVDSYRVLTNVIRAREQLVLEKAQQDIEEYRKGDVTIVLVDNKGNRLSNATVEYRQVSHDFVFCVGWPSAQQYTRLRSAGFEYASFESWWGEIETSDGVYRFPDSEMEQLRRAGFGIVMHASIWLTPAYAPATPRFVASLNPAGMSSQAYQYSYDILTHYKGRIAVYDAFNEPDLHQAYRLTLDELVDIVRSSISGAKRADPIAVNYVNIAYPIFESVINSYAVDYSVAYDQFGNIRPVPIFEPPAPSGYDFLKAMNEARVDVDAIGLEFYYGVVSPPIDLGLFADTLDFYGNSSRKVFISELSYATLDDYPGSSKWWQGWGGWHEGYTDKAQADWARCAMTIAFSRPYVNGIQWVGASDGPEGYDFVGDALFHKDGVTPRPVLSAIGGLIDSWTTKGNGVTDKTGSLTFRGFGGDYELAIIAQDGRVFHTKAYIPERQNQVLQLIVDTSPPVLKSVSPKPTVVKNGDVLEIRADAGEAGLVVTADVARLDSTKREPIALKQEPDGTYKGSITISLGNSATNGIKTITVNAIDTWENVGVSTTTIRLKNSAPVLDAVPPNDNFDGRVLHLTKWRPDISSGGVVKQDGRLIASTDSRRAYSTARVESVWEFTGDFDVQVDFQIGEGWSSPAVGHLDGAFLGVNIAGQSYHITRLRSGGEDKLYAWSTTGALCGQAPSSILAGKFRLIRTRNTLALLYDIGTGWQELASVAVPASHARVYLGNGSIDASQAFTTLFDNFHINSGRTTYSP